MIFHVETSGTIGINKNFDALGEALRDKFIKHAVKAALEPVKEDAKARVKDRTGALKGSIIVVVKSKGTKGTTIRGTCGPGTKIRIPIRVVSRGKHKNQLAIAIPTRYAHLVEFGHKVVINGKVVGHVGPKAFMRPAWAAHGGDTAFRVLETDLAEQISAWLASLP